MFRFVPVIGMAIFYIASMPESHASEKKIVSIIEPTGKKLGQDATMTGQEDACDRRVEKAKKSIWYKLSGPGGKRYLVEWARDQGNSKLTQEKNRQNIAGWIETLDDDSLMYAIATKYFRGWRCLSIHAAGSEDHRKFYDKLTLEVFQAYMAFEYNWYLGQLKTIEKSMDRLPDRISPREQKTEYRKVKNIKPKLTLNWPSLFSSDERFSRWGLGDIEYYRKNPTSEKFQPRVSDGGWETRGAWLDLLSGTSSRYKSAQTLLKTNYERFKTTTDRRANDIGTPLALATAKNCIAKRKENFERLYAVRATTLRFLYDSALATVSEQQDNPDLSHIAALLKINNDLAKFSVSKIFEQIPESDSTPIHDPTGEPSYFDNLKVIQSFRAQHTSPWTPLVNGAKMLGQGLGVLIAGSTVLVWAPASALWQHFVSDARGREEFLAPYQVLQEDVEDFSIEEIKYRVAKHFWQNRRHACRNNPGVMRAQIDRLSQSIKTEISWLEEKENQESTDAYVAKLCQEFQNDLLKQAGSFHMVTTSRERFAEKENSYLNGIALKTMRKYATRSERRKLRKAESSLAVQPKVFEELLDNIMKNSKNYREAKQELKKKRGVKYFKLLPRAVAGKIPKGFIIESEGQENPTWPDRRRRRQYLTHKNFLDREETFDALKSKRRQDLAGYDLAISRSTDKKGESSQLAGPSQLFAGMAPLEARQKFFKNWRDFPIDPKPYCSQLDGLTCAGLCDPNKNVRVDFSPKLALTVDNMFINELVPIAVPDNTIPGPNARPRDTEKARIQGEISRCSGRIDEYNQRLQRPFIQLDIESRAEYENRKADQRAHYESQIQRQESLMADLNRELRSLDNETAVAEEGPASLDQNQHLKYLHLPTCGHALCTECFENLRGASVLSGKPFNCPYCGDSSPIPYHWDSDERWASHVGTPSRTCVSSRWATCEQA